MLTRRNLLDRIAASVGVAAGISFFAQRAFAAETTAETFEIVHTEAEWKQLLTPQQFNVLRKQGTEPPGSSPLDHEKAAGTYDCAGCALPVFSSAAKFDSGTGWPSFWQPLPNAINETASGSRMFGTEVHCHRCGGHLGHVFNDGPPPTGLRYCINGVALKFVPEGSASSSKAG